MARPPVFPAEEKVRIVLSILAGEITVAEAARRPKVSEQSVGNWRRQFLEAGKSGLAAGKSGPSTRYADVLKQDLSSRRGERGRHSIIEYRFRRFHQRKQRRTRSSCRRRDQGRDRRGRAPWDLLGDQVKIDRSLTACTCAKNIDARSRRWAPRRAERTASSHGCGSLTRSDDCCTISLVSWPSARPLVIVVAMLDRGSSELACGSRRRRPSHDGLDSLLAHRRRQDLRRQAQRQAAVGGQFRTRDERTTGGGEEEHRPRDLRRRATATEGRRRAGRRVRRLQRARRHVDADDVLARVLRQ